MTLSFQSRRNNVEIKKLQRKLKTETDECELELLQIELEEKLYSKANMELVAKHRVREIEQWSMLKKELDDGTFDINDVNTHQMESLTKQLENRAGTLSANSAPAEVANVIGPLATAKRLQMHMHQSILNKSITHAVADKLTFK